MDYSLLNKKTPININIILKVQQSKMSRLEMYICQITTAPKTAESGGGNITYLGWNPFSGLFFPGEGWGRLHFSLCHSLPEPGYLCLTERWGYFPPFGRQTTPISTMCENRHTDTHRSDGILWLVVECCKTSPGSIARCQVKWLVGSIVKWGQLHYFFDKSWTETKQW